MGKMDVHFSSVTHTWETPDALYRKVNQHFRFTIDLAASKRNRKCVKYLSAKQDALSVPWGRGEGRGWCNPPYGRGIASWVAKAFEEVREEKNLESVTLLLPARTDTGWFQPLADVAQIRFLPGRLTFEIDGKPMLESIESVRARVKKSKTYKAARETGDRERAREILARAKQHVQSAPFPSMLATIYATTNSGGERFDPAMLVWDWKNEPYS